MDKTTLGLMGAIVAAGAVNAQPASAAPVEPMAQARSYAELLDPIPNAVERLALVNSQADRDGGRLIEAQYAPDGGPVAHHHHHHHHHNSYVAPRETYYAPPRVYRHYRHHHRRPVVVHHHHHHHHNNY